jgi:glycosyl hydrolase family 9/cellulase-like Ig domain-containing protein/cellulose/xylan binding protein with CBM9 domain
MVSRLKRGWVLALMLLFPLFVHAQDQTSLAPAEIKGQAMYIPFPVAITLDGKVDDWAGVPSAVVDRGTMLSSKPGENDSFTVAVAADDKNLYVLMTSSDPNIITGQHGTDYWNEDSLEFYVNFSDELNAPAYGDGIYQININPGNIGTTDPTALSFTGVNATASNVQGVAFKTEDGWGFEAAVPLPFAPEHGKTIGFQAQANGATQLDRDVKLIWSLADTADQSWQNPALFGRGVFFEVGRTDIPEVDVTSIGAVVPTVVPQENETVSERPITTVNQVGYFVDGQKIAVYGRADQSPMPSSWQVREADSGNIILSGTTDAGIMDATSGDFVYRADFSGLNAPGKYIVQIDGVDSPPFLIADDVYATLKKDALRYFYLNRSGIELTPEFAGETWARPAGHISDNDITCYKGTDADGKTWDGCDYRLDGSGGWYDAGDYGKYVVNGGISTWTLVNLYEHSPKDFPDGSLNIPESQNGLPDILDEARWEMDFMLRMQVPEGQPLAGMAHHKLHDLHWSGVPSKLPTEFDNDSPTNGRYLMPPSTAATLNLAATAAQCARVWKSLDADFAARCLKAAEIAWAAAKAHPDMFYGRIPGEGGGDYSDGNVQDEFYWAAAELFITTGKDEYRTFVSESPFFKTFPNGVSPMGWPDTAALGSISLAMLPNDLPEADITRLRQQITETADQYLDAIAAEGYRVPIPASGYVWGSNSLVLNNAIIMALAYDFSKDAKYRDGVVASMDYILGTNAVDQSFVSGYGTNAMQHPHHRFWGNQPEQGFPPPPPGAIAGGPNGSPAEATAIKSVGDLPTSRRYIDNIGSYSTNEVAINWNAPLVWVAAYLDEQFNGGS